MADQVTLDAIETGELILQVDAGRAAADPFKLPVALNALVATRLGTCKGKNAAATLMEGSTIGAAGQRQQALDRLSVLLHSGYNSIVAVDTEDITNAERAHTFAAYGWEQGLLGDTTSALRIEALGNAAAIATVDPSVPTAGKYSATLMTRISNWLALLEAASLVANGGSRQVAISERNVATGDLAAVNARVRHSYCGASDDGDGTAELAKIGMQPKRAPGDAQPQPFPDAAGTVTFDPVTRNLSISALPDHASFLRAYRKPAGGAVELAGVSADTTVSVVGITPLTPGVTYEVWVVGVNSRGEGTISNKITFTA